MATKIECPDCSAPGVTVTPVVQRWLYGDKAQVELSATVPEYHCAACGFTWTDHEAEKIRDEAVHDHLARIKRD